MNLVFLVPIRHPQNCKNPEDQARYLQDLLTSMTNQSSDQWRAILIANTEQALPPLPDGVSVATVDLPPNTALAEAPDRNRFYRLIRRDKGLRLRRGLVEVAPDDLVMITDDDDLLHTDLVKTVMDHAASGVARAWYVKDGYTWRTGDPHFRKLDNFHKICGTSLICPPQFYDAYHDKDATGDMPSTSELGSHKLVFDKIGTGPEGFQPLSLRAAVYRQGHINASQTDLPAHQRVGWRRYINRSMVTRRGISRLFGGSVPPAVPQPEDVVPLTPDLATAFFGRQDSPYTAP